MSEIRKIADLLKDPELRSDVFGNSSGTAIRLTHTRSGLSVTMPMTDESVSRGVDDLRRRVAAAGVAWRAGS